jgi:hypothetical protein
MKSKDITSLARTGKMFILSLNPIAMRRLWLDTTRPRNISTNTFGQHGPIEPFLGSEGKNRKTRIA